MTRPCASRLSASSDIKIDPGSDVTLVFRWRLGQIGRAMLVGASTRPIAVVVVIIIGILAVAS